MNGDDPSSLSSAPSPSSMQTTTATLTSNKRRHSRAAEPSRKYSVPDAASIQHRRGSSGSLFLSPTPQQKRLPPTPHGQDENSPDTSLMDIDDPRPRGAKRTPFGPHDAYNNHHANPSQDSLNSSQKSTRPRPADQRSSRGSFYEDRRKSISSLMIQPRAPSPPLPQLPQEVVDDIYGNLKTFRFGNASPAGSPSDGNQSDQDEDVMSPLPRRSPRKMSRVVVNDDHPLHAPSSDNDTDEEEKMRQERSKMRAIDDGGRRPSLPINHAVYPSTSSSTPAVSRATLGSMSEQLDRQLERRRPSQAISIPRRSSRVSQDEHGKWPGDPQSEPESVRMPWMAAGASADAAADFDMNFILNVSQHSLSCPPSPTGTDLVGDTFLNHITRFDTEYGQQRSAWLVARQFLTLESGRQDPREVWACDFVGKFNVMRGLADQPGTTPSKLRANQILVRQYADMAREGRRSRRLSGPSMWIHNHGRKKVISIFREYNPFKKDETMTPAASILFTPRDLRSFHTRNRPRVQYHDETLPSRSTKSSRSGHASSTASTSQPQEHVYPPSYMGTPQPRSTTPRVRSPPGSIAASLTSVDDLPHRRGHADAFSTIDNTRLAPTQSATSGVSDTASTTTSNVQRSGGSSFTGFFKRKGKDKVDKVFEPPWLTVHPRQQTEEEIERMLFAPWDVPRPSDVSGPDSTSPRVSESSTSPLSRPEASSSRTVHAQAQEETEEEKTRRRVRNLSQSFESVGLIASPKRPKSTSRAPLKTTPTFLDNVPADSTCFLLPLWPSEAASGKNEFSRPSYHIPMTERRYLLVYFVQQAPLNKKRPRQPNAASDATPQASASGAADSFLPFHVVAQLVTSNDLLLAGMRSLDKGLLVTGTISDSLLVVPDVPAEDARSIIIALCNDVHALEFVPEGLDKLGLRVEPDDDMSVVGESGKERERGLTPIGRAIAEIIWAACLAVASNLPSGGV